MALFDSELKVMEVLWEEGSIRASEVAKMLKERTGWNRNTTYTIIKRMVEKGIVKRTDPNFICTAVLSRETAQQSEATEVVDKLFDGSADLFLSAFLSGNELGSDEIDRLKKLVEDLK